MKRLRHPNRDPLNRRQRNWNTPCATSEGTKPVAEVAKDLGISESRLRNWMSQAVADENGGSAVRLTSTEKKGPAELRRRNWQLQYEETRRHRAGIGDQHTTSIKKPQRSTADRHAYRTRRHSASVALPDQLEVPLLDRTRHLVRSITRHPAIPSMSRSQPPMELKASKWADLAKYALTHPVDLRRVVAVIRDAGGTMRSLDLTQTDISERLAVAADRAGLEALFEERGTNY
ncbi:phage terminase small subunit-related protein [Actinophytocola gossypii]|uniref:Transposase n=1 Tax=Actinophytocola gossypii TaxID=2812003 RepID=A0ABT2J9V9_9PSEU|nr:phage terminase small subunit-related protein [Actinophytocola gossypii]MCT2584646.1 transposase [Actinophytocola gossypii]